MKIDKIYTEDAGTWKRCKELATQLYGPYCLFHKKLLKYRSYNCFTKITPAHVFGKGSSHMLALVPLNIIPLALSVHSDMDTNIDPRTGIKMSREEKVALWKILIGEKKYERLCKLRKEYYENARRY